MGFKKENQQKKKKKEKKRRRRKKEKTCLRRDLNLPLDAKNREKNTELNHASKR